MGPPCAQPCGVQVGVVDAGDHRAPIQLDHGAGIEGFRIVASGDDHPVTDGEGSDDRIRGVEGVDAAAADDQIGLVAVE